MSGFDNWNKKTSDYLEEIFDKNHKNIDFDMWDEYCATLEQIGIRDLEEIYQEALDAIK